MTYIVFNITEKNNMNLYVYNGNFIYKNVK